jgi:anaerobic magnesium-protoporphyrin IX monomethyl ester cyclase
MNILLFSMPDSFEHMPTIAVRMPNGALTSLAGNVDPHHRVAAADLLLVQNRIRETVERLVAEHEPDVVGLSVMTFQRKTAKGIIDLVRTRRPRARVVVGGYDPSLAPEAYTEDPDGGVDFIVRGEGEITFRELLRARGTARVRFATSHYAAGPTAHLLVRNGPAVGRGDWIWKYFHCNEVPAR